MLGRIVGFVAGAAIATAGYGMLRPAVFAKYLDFSKLSLGPFAEYKAIVCWLIVAFGAVVAVAALQRPTGGRRRRPSPPVSPAPAQAARTPSPAHGPLDLGPEPEAEPAQRPLEDDEADAAEPAHHPIMHEVSSASRRTPTPLW
jgi:hypothetical protein